MKLKLDKSGWGQVLYATPVVLISTRSPAGVDNVSPYGMCMPISSNPPLFAVGVHPSRDTYQYIKEHQEFAINFLTPELKEECLITAKGIPSEESEFDLADLTRKEAEKINVALVKESPVNFECKLHWIKKAGDHDIVVGEIVTTWIEEEYYDEDNTKMRTNFDNLYHINERYFNRGYLIE